LKGQWIVFSEMGSGIHNTSNESFSPVSMHSVLSNIIEKQCRASAEGPKPLIGLVGHVGIGHAHGHSGIVQDDSVGFACIIAILRAAFPVDLRIASVQADPITGRIVLTTHAGGVGEALPRRGITPQEKELMKKAVGYDASFCQSLACQIFGRIYGQGVLECPVCFEAAAAFAVVDSFRRCWQGFVNVREVSHDDNRDVVLGATIALAGQVVSLLAVVNFTSGGIGPNEDAEGNTFLGQKKEIMFNLGLDGIPSIIVESKAFIPSYCQTLDQRSLFTRINRSVDNTVVAQALVDGAAKAGLPMKYDFDSYPRDHALEQNTINFAAQLKVLAQALSHAHSSGEKVRILSTLAKLISEDAGAITFMSNDIHAVVGSGGSMPGTAAVLSMLVPQPEAKYWKIPVLYQEDLDMYLAAIVAAIEVLKKALPEASKELQDKQHIFGTLSIMFK
jgi:hypothetical protein